MRNTQFIIALLAFMAIATIAVFGFSMMGHSDGTIGNCSGPTSGDCPAMIFTHVFAHMNAFQSLSTAVLGIIVLLIAFAYGVTISLTHDEDEKRIFYALHYSEVLGYPYRIKFSRWIAHHEKRDPSFAFAVAR